MKTIGIVGGLAWPSTVIYYRTINELAASAARTANQPCARCENLITPAQAAVEMALADEPVQPGT